MNTIQRVRIFVASPGELGKERAAVVRVGEEIRRTIGNTPLLDIEVVRWETHAWPDVGIDAQDVINRQIGDFDVFVGILWKRFGTPTKRADSGTAEEFQRAFRLYREYGRPRIMFYFRASGFYPSRDDLQQFGKVLEFKADLEKAGVLYWSYQRPIDFERLVREHLLHQLLDVTRTLR